MDINKYLQFLSNPYCLTAIFNAIDYLTGWLQSVANGTFKSSIMRRGIFHKLSIWIVLVVVALYDVGKKYVDLGVFGQFPVSKCVCAMFIIMEISSIMENVHLMNNDIPGGFKDLIDLARKMTEVK